ncbi:MAG TPA: tRNA (guanosine(37)-N1)-methyltransferase TrmD [Candidatus Limnocylindrales bacterium]|nr:tRNA (guanosine(37)-N1)-methyltransferase TrmD [Candidatus Limnocylindrales bacterium]
MKIDLVTIFPGVLEGPFSESMLKRAVGQGLVEINLVDLRLFTHDKHRQVDDAPYGGGFGMILKPEPLYEAVTDLKLKAGVDHSWVILLSPQGRTFNQQVARELSLKKHIILLCGRYEGIDDRVRTLLVDDEISIGDFVLTGGELAAAVLVDAVVRLLPGFLAEEAVVNESFTDSLLEHPHYTRPPVFRGMEVPPVLLSGNHGEIKRWRRQQSLIRTLEKRPDLLQTADLSPDEKAYLDKIKAEK